MYLVLGVWYKGGLASAPSTANPVDCPGVKSNELGQSDLCIHLFVHSLSSEFELGNQAGGNGSQNEEVIG